MAIRKLTQRTVHADVSVQRNTTRPSLNLDFANTQTLDGRISFNRNSIGTYLGRDGYIKTALENEPRFEYGTDGKCKGLLIEPSRSNLFDYTNTPSRWATINAAFTERTVETRAPDGTYGATKVVATNTDPYLYQTPTVSSGTTYCLSVYIKGTGSTIGKGVNLRIGGFATTVFAITGEWQRVYLVGTSNTTGNVNVGFEIPEPYNGTNPVVGDTYYVWGAQFEVGSYPTSFIPSKEYFYVRSSTASYLDRFGYLKTAPVNAPREAYAYDAGSGTMIERGMLIENQSSNLILQSEDFSSWGKSSGASVTSNAAIAPDGSSTADLIVKEVYQYYTKPAGNYTYTLSVYAKAGTSNDVNIALSDNTTGQCSATFNLTTGTFTTSTGTWTNPYAAVEQLPNGWWRCIVTGTSPSGTTVLPNIVVPVATNSVLLWGAQLEQASFPSSYIATTSVAVTRSADQTISSKLTRSADDAVMGIGVGVDNWFNYKEGTIVAEFDCYISAPPVSHNFGIVTFDNYGALDDRLQLRFTNTGATDGSQQYGQLILSDADGTPVGTQGNVWDSTTPLGTSSHKIAGAYKTNDFVLYKDSTLIGVDTAGSIPRNVNRQMKLGYVQGGVAGGYLSGHLSRVAYYPSRLTNVEMSELTS